MITRYTAAEKEREKAIKKILDRLYSVLPYVGSFDLGRSEVHRLADVVAAIFTEQDTRIRVLEARLAITKQSLQCVESMVFPLGHV